MSEPEIPNQPLLGDRNQQAGNAQGARPSRAFKVAGLTLLVSVLIVGQALTIYFVFSQKSDITSLRQQSNQMESQMTKSRSVAVPMRMSMNVLPNMMDFSEEGDSSTKDPEETGPQQATSCQLEAVGLKPVQVPSFRPACDERGLYRAMQCFQAHCWCVNPADGQQLQGSLRKGPVDCSTPVSTDSVSELLARPVVD